MSSMTPKPPIASKFDLSLPEASSSGSRDSDLSMPKKRQAGEEYLLRLTGVNSKRFVISYFNINKVSLQYKWPIMRPITDNLCPYLGKSERDKTTKLGARFLGRSQETEHSEKVQLTHSDHSSLTKVGSETTTETKHPSRTHGKNSAERRTH